MPRTIDEGFRDFLGQLTPNQYESQAATDHRASIEDCLKSNFGLNRFVRIGSFGNGTSISGYSDVDYLASIPTKSMSQNSQYFLNKVRGALADRFSTTTVCVRSPAVALLFGSIKSEHTEIVPADYIGSSNGFSVYEIADGSGGWMNASPDAHNDYVKSIDAKLKNKVRPLVRFIKAWKYYNNIPISSFYLELRIAKYAHSQELIIYEYDVRDVFAHLLTVDLANMHDPMEVSGYITACSSQEKRQKCLSELNSALFRAKNARDAEKKGDTKTAFFWWQCVFANNFPAYYK